MNSRSACAPTTTGTKSSSRLRARKWTSSARANALDHLGERAEHRYAGSLERGALGGVGAVAAVHQRAGVAHGDALRGAAPGDQSVHRLREALHGKRPSEFLLLRSADLP